MHVFVSEDHMLDWHSCQICYPLEINIIIIVGELTHTSLNYKAGNQY